jgi:lipoate-protein ligase B
MVTKWNWEYSECLSFQKQAQKFIQNNRKLKVYIFTNHPHCFTLGRGNERGDDTLVPFEKETAKDFKFPLYNIHRGGGLTFHYPGQWIFYPILALKESFALGDLSWWMLKSVQKTLSEKFYIDNVITATKLMGVWRNKQKLASIGIGASRFVTEHGLALNLIYDKKMFDEVNKTSPCGINPETYTSVDRIINNDSNNLIAVFHKHFLQIIIAP